MVKKMCKKCKGEKVGFWDFAAQEHQYNKQKVPRRDRCYVCKKCGTKFHMTKTKIMSEFIVRCLAIVAVIEMLAMTESIGIACLFGTEISFVTAKVIESLFFIAFIILIFPLLVILNSFVHWIFGKSIRWIA